MKILFYIQLLLVLSTASAKASQSPEFTGELFKTASEYITSYHFNNIDNRIKEYEGLFTVDGYKKFTRQIAKTQLLQTVKAGRYMVTSASLCTPKIKESNNGLITVETPLKTSWINHETIRRYFLLLELNFINTGHSSGAGYKINDFKVKRIAKNVAKNCSKQK